MKQTWLGVVAAIALVTLVGGGASAQVGSGSQMGHGTMCPGTMGPTMGPGMGPGMMGPPGAAQITEDKAKAVAQQYANNYLQGFTVDKVLPFTTGMGMTMYSAELKGPQGEYRTLHVNPWGGAMPCGGPWRRSG